MQIGIFEEGNNITVRVLMILELFSTPDGVLNNDNQLILINSQKNVCGKR